MGTAFRIFLIFTALIGEAAEPKRKHKEFESVLVPLKNGTNTPTQEPLPTKPDGSSEVRPTENGVTPPPLQGAKNGPSYLNGSDGLGLTRVCDRKISLDSLFAFPRPESLQVFDGHAAYLSQGKAWHIVDKAGTPKPWENVSAATLLTTSPDGLRAAAISSAGEKSTIVFQEKAGPRKSVEISGTVLSARWNGTGGELLLTAGTGTTCRLLRLSPGTDKPKDAGIVEGVGWLTDVSPDGKTAAFTAERPGDRSDVWLWELGTNQTRRWMKSTGRAEGARFTADGKGLFYLDDGKKGRAQLYYSPLAKPDTFRVVGTSSGEITTFALSPSRTTLAFEGNEDGYSHLGGFTVDEAGRTRGALAVPKFPAGVVESLAFIDDSRWLIVRSSTLEPHEIWLADQGQASLWSRFHPDAPSPACWSGEVPVRYPSFDGKKVPAFLYPVSGKSSPPGAVLVEGNPSETFRPRFHPLVRYLVERGIAVLAPNPRGRAGYGRDWRALDDGAKHGNAAKDVAWGARWIAETKHASAEHLRGVGIGYGGWLVLTAERFVPASFTALGLTDPWLDLTQKILETPAWERSLWQSEFSLGGETGLPKDPPTLPVGIYLTTATADRTPATERITVDKSTASGRTAHARALVLFLESKEKRKGP